MLFILLISLGSFYRLSIRPIYSTNLSMSGFEYHFVPPLNLIFLSRFDALESVYLSCPYHWSFKLITSLWLIFLVVERCHDKVFNWMVGWPVHSNLYDGLLILLHKILIWFINNRVLMFLIFVFVFIGVVLILFILL